ncbi:arsenate reductase ArsC [Methylotenera sp.]|jgi:arsenate reductase|uniref:Protein-tyrosine-phosphatase n=1 Tax=Methylotenera mobilis TaxID=359408 RepID=A0A351RAK6_9PROT|nr:arsenate reductase ArsC [Methylotenera sp.]MDP3210942.1 arsenate reductase ArsC [Methylotenera sp.]MDP3776660.1 arsenate reductase ArsC [Methylotenera sp.]HBA09077.1 protein-tyrosine-phosphatase [Methylotenera mobilis]
MIVKTYNVLIVDTKNSARSIMAEALFNTMGDGVYQAYSAGSSPSGVVNRFAIEQIKTINYPTKNLRSKSWNEFLEAKTPIMNFVISLCDIDKDTLPAWHEKSIYTHWEFDDPSTVDGTFDEKKAAYKKVFQQIQNKIDLFTQLPLAHLNQESLNRAIEKWKSK